MTVAGDEAQRGHEVAARVAALRELLDRRGDPAALLTSRRNFAWLTAGGTGHVVLSSEAAIAGLLVTPGEVVAITQNIEAARLADEELSGLPIEVVAVPWWEPAGIAGEAARRLAGRRGATDADLEADLVALRSGLSPFDRERLAALAGLARDAAAAALATVTDGMTEDELATEALAALPGVRVPVLLVAADRRIGAYRHPLPGPTPIRRRVMLVLVVERWGLHAAITRFRELEPPSPDLVRRLAGVADVQDAMLAATRPGETFGTVFDAARAAYARLGFPDEWRDHHQGGSIGYQARERVASPDDPTEVRPGMAFAWNPSIAGAKAEETIVLDDTGRARVLTAG